MPPAVWMQAARTGRLHSMDVIIYPSFPKNRSIYPCRKCLTPVNTIATPSLSAASITSASRTEPPG